MPPVGDQGFTAVPNFVWKRFQGPLSLFCLLRYRGDNVTGESWYAHDSMAEDLGASVSSVRRWLQELVDQNLVTVEKRVTDLGKQGTNLYRVVGVLDGCSDLNTLGYSDVDNELINNSLTRSTNKELNTKNNVPEKSGEPTVGQIANDITGAFYDSQNGAINFNAVRGVVTKLLKAGHEPESVASALAAAETAGKPLTVDVLRQMLNGRQGGGRVVSDTEQRGREQLREMYARMRDQEGNTDEAQ